jgi:hypothetical protein
MSVSNSNSGGTKFKFVASDGGVSQKRSQVTQACELCRKRKKRCNHTERSSGVTSHVHHSPSTTSPSSTSQAAPMDSPANSTSHQFKTSSGLDERQYHAETSLTTSNSMEGNGQRIKPAGVTKANGETQVRRFSILLSSIVFSRIVIHGKDLFFFEISPCCFIVLLSMSRHIVQYFQTFCSLMSPRFMAHLSQVKQILTSSLPRQRVQSHPRLSRPRVIKVLDL